MSKTVSRTSFHVTQFENEAFNPKNIINFDGGGGFAIIYWRFFTAKELFEHPYLPY